VTRDRSIFARGARVVFSYVAMHPGPFAVAVAGATLYASMTVGTTVVLGRITDRVLVPAFHHRIGVGPVLAAVAALVGVGVLRAAGVIGRRYFAAMTASRSRRSLQSRVVERYQELPLSYHRSHPAGELLAHVEADVQSAIDALHPLPWSLAVVLLVVFAGVALLVIDPLLAGVAWFVLPGVALLNRWFGKRVEEPAMKVQERIGDIAAVAHESIDGALVVKVLGLQDAEVARMEYRARLLRDERVRLGALRAAFEPAFEALPSLGIVLLLMVGSWQVSTGSISVGTLVEFVALFQLTAAPLRLIGDVLSHLPHSVAGDARLKEVYREPVEHPTSNDGTRLPDGPLGLAIRSMSFSYGNANVIENVTFDVPPSSSIAIVGPTGAGKSTLVHLMTGLAHPKQGTIAIGGVDLKRVDNSSLRETVAVVFQESYLFASSIRDNIAFDLAVSDEEIERAARLAQADTFIHRLPNGYDTVVGERGVTLSGGQRQRIALARALVRRPRILILDDATSAVDPVVERRILAGLRDEVDASLIVVAYRVATIELADRLVFLLDGKVAGEGTHEELLKDPSYRSVLWAFESSAGSESPPARSRLS
jgi:ATP-binding cassette subfamily B protein